MLFAPLEGCLTLYRIVMPLGTSLFNQISLFTTKGTCANTYTI
jgi:hypothetical protein